MATQTVKKNANQTWDDYMASIESPTLRAAIECYVALWYPNHNAYSEIEVSEYFDGQDVDTETEEDIQRYR